MSTSDPRPDPLDQIAASAASEDLAKESRAAKSRHASPMVWLIVGGILVVCLGALLYVFVAGKPAPPLDASPPPRKKAASQKSATAPDRKIEVAPAEKLDPKPANGKAEGPELFPQETAPEKSKGD